MVKKLIAIGGGENGRLLEDGTKSKYETRLMDEEIVRLTNKKNPNYLFIVHAMSFSEEIEDSYYNTMKKIYGDMFGCNCKCLKAKDLTNIDYVKELVDWADIIYEGGGDTRLMLDLWKKTDFDKLLKDAWYNGKVICGISAGAVCWFNSCNSDTEDGGFESINCLDWFDLYVTPHADEDGRYESSKNQLKDSKKIGIMLSNCSAIEIIDDEYRIISENGNERNFDKGYALKCFWKDNKFNEIKLDDSNEFKKISDLCELDI